VEDSAESLKITIADNGIGIPESDLGRVFEPFTRVDDSRSKASGGTGLGLSIAKNIAQAHGGTLSLRNREGGGLIAEVVLPRTREIASVVLHSVWNLSGYWRE
jgi:signal transduction histidine kinase